MRLPTWTTYTPILAAVMLALTWGRYPGALVLTLAAVLLMGAVVSAVHHAEVVAHKVGEPFGSLLLAVAVTIIEVGLIVTLMVTSDGRHLGTRARHRLRRGDDHDQRHHGPVAARERAPSTGWRSSTPRAPRRR